MKLSVIAALLSFLATSYASQVVIDQSFSKESGSKHGDLLVQLRKAYPEYDLDLTEKRLVQLDPSDAPVLLSELEKVRSGRLPTHALTSAD